MNEVRKAKEIEIEMKIIDAHIHFSAIESFKDTARLYSGVDYSSEGLVRECAENGVVSVIGMGVTENARYAFPDYSASTPMPCDLENAPAFLKTCPGINPYVLNDLSLCHLEQALKNGAAGIKIYAGYYPFRIDDPVYAPVYDIAEKYGKPVVIHTGDTYSERGLLAYAKPLHADRLAVKRRGLNFVLSHMGDPWILDACETAYKNKNVYIDLSGLIVGDENEVTRVMNEPLLAGRFRQGLLYLNDYQKVLFGTDWPLVPMKPYIRFCQSMVPEERWPEVFYGNAERLFGSGIGSPATLINPQPNNQKHRQPPSLI